MGRLAEEFGYLLLPGVALCNIQGEGDQAVLVRLKLNAVHCQKDDGRRRAGPFVAVQERMVLHYVVELRRRHLEEILVKELSFE